MAKGEADFAPVRFSTEDLPERDRIPVWREVFGRSVIGTEIEPAPEVPFHADVTVRSLPSLDLVSSVMSPVRFSRTPALLADGNDDIGFFMNSSGGIMSQRGREITFGAGAAVVMTAAEAATTAALGTWYRCLHIRRAALAPFVANLDDAAILRSIPPDSEALQYLLSYSRFVLKDRTLANTELARVAATHLCDLFALMLGATRDGAALAEARGLSAARLAAIKADIIANMGRRDLSLAFISARHGLSERHIRRLFRAGDTSFSDFVVEQRLVRAYRMLSDPRFAGRTISAIAFECGFNEVSYFNRAFRRRFGAAPSDVRAPL